MVVSILLYGCTTWTLTKRIEKKLDRNSTRMLRSKLNKSWNQHPTKQQLYGHLPPISKTIQIRRTRHAGRCWRSKDELISVVVLWTPTHGRTSVGRPAKTCSLDDLPVAIDNRDEWQQRERQTDRQTETEKSMLAVRFDDDDIYKLLVSWHNG